MFHAHPSQDIPVQCQSLGSQSHAPGLNGFWPLKSLSCALLEKVDGKVVKVSTCPRRRPCNGLQTSITPLSDQGMRLRVCACVLRVVRLFCGRGNRVLIPRLIRRMRRQLNARPLSRRTRRAGQVPASYEGMRYSGR